MLLVNFVSGFRLESMYMSFIVSIRSSLTHLHTCFSAVCAAATVHRNHFLCFYQQNKSSESKGKFRQASNHCKRVLEAVKLAYANKTKESITFQKLGSWEFCQIANSFLNKGKSAISPLFNSPKVLFSASDKVIRN